LQAAMCLLAVSQPALAADALTRAHEAVLAYVICDALQQAKNPVDLKLLALSAERDHRVYVAADLLQQHPRGPAVHVPLMASRYPDEDLAHQFSAWTPEQHQQAAAQALAGGDIATAVLHSVCAGDHAQAAEVGVQQLFALFQTADWSIDQARQIMDPLESVPLQDMEVRHIANVLACAAYIGLVEARLLNYTALIFPLAQTWRNIVTHQKLAFPVSSTYVAYLEATATSQSSPSHALKQLTDLLSSTELSEDMRAHVQQEIAATQARTSTDEAAPAPSGLAKMSGADLPTCYKRFAKTSVLTNQLIKGPAFGLEDKKMHVALPDALAWARVNGFSPLNTGCKIHPL